MVLSLIHLLLLRLKNKNILNMYHQLSIYQIDYDILKLLLEYIKLEDLHKLKINVVDKIVKKKITIRQIMYCLTKNDYELKNINNYDTESWNYYGINYLKFRIFTDDSKFWYCNDKLHNDDTDENNNLMPAVIDENGYQYYYLYDVYLHTINDL